VEPAVLAVTQVKKRSNALKEVSLVEGQTPAAIIGGMELKKITRRWSDGA
jgi:hypothetical protein